MILSQALKTDDFDTALMLLMTPLGITDGGVAEMAFNDVDDPQADWKAADYEARSKMLVRWFSNELFYITTDIVAP